jgi:hypothetical protein
MWRERIQVVVDYFDFLCHQIVQGYTLHVHTAGGWKGIHPVRLCCWLWKRYTLHVILLEAEIDTPFMSKLKEVEGDAPFTSIDGCCWRKVSPASAFLPAFTFFKSGLGILA